MTSYGLGVIEKKKKKTKTVRFHLGFQSERGINSFLRVWRFFNSPLVVSPNEVTLIWAPAVAWCSNVGLRSRCRSSITANQR